MVQDWRGLLAVRRARNMFPFPKRKPKPTPVWIKLAMIGFLIYALLIGTHRVTPEHSSALQALEKTGHDLSLKKLFPAPGSFTWKDLEPGSGARAICGQKATLSYDSFLPNNQSLENAGKDKPLTFRIGSRNVVPALDAGVIGMKKSGKRSIEASGAWAYGDKPFAPEDSPVRFEIELLDLSPALPDIASLPYRIADIAPGQGAAIACGDLVRARITLWSAEGKKLYESKEPLAFTPGKSEVFLGLEQGVIGMQPSGARTLIVPPALQKTMEGNTPPVTLPLPKQQTVLVDIAISD